jgi:putative hydrolase of the HAD superfamily
MEIKAIGFDIGHTLVKYNSPLNWKSLYPDALRKVLYDCRIDKTDNKMELAIRVLSKYNTRENPREYEVSSDRIFKEIFDVWGEPYEPYDGIIAAKNAFYGFFQADAVCFDDTVEVLDKLTASGIHIGFLTDVAYGMDNEYALADIAPIRSYFDIGFTSVDVGFRKPNTAGYKMLLAAFHLTPSQMLYVGDEEKDIAGANDTGITSVLINRSGEERYWGQKYTIRNLCELEELL